MGWIMITTKDAIGEIGLVLTCGKASTIAEPWTLQQGKAIQIQHVLAVKKNVVYIVGRENTELPAEYFIMDK